jgi:hypothetical protein
LVSTNDEARVPFSSLCSLDGHYCWKQQQANLREAAALYKSSDEAILNFVLSLPGSVLIPKIVGNRCVYE